MDSYRADFEALISRLGFNWGYSQADQSYEVYLPDGTFLGRVACGRVMTKELCRLITDLAKAC